MAHITRKCVVKIPNLPQLENVCYVTGLKTNLPSINQLCDAVANEVCSSKRCCKVIGKDRKNMLIVPRSRSNCYSFVIPKGGEHTNWKKETNISWVLRGQPHLLFSQYYLCEVCNLEKHSMMSHIGVTYSRISKTPHLVEMISSNQTLMVFYGKIKTISIVSCIKNQKYVSLYHVLFLCDILLWILYLLNNFGVKLLTICFHCDLMCEIDFLE